MKFLSLPSFDVVSGALNFDTPDCHVTGSCDLYTTKAAGSDKKLYKNINQSLESRDAALLKFGASLSPPQRDSMAASLNLSRSSPFGNLSEVSSRRTYAYLIATLNASHPDYDFSHVLRPADFKREKALRHVMNSIDSTLGSVRPNSSLLDAAAASGAHGYSPGSAAAAAGGSGFGAMMAMMAPAPAWGPQMWATIDQEMTLKDCDVFAYQPADCPFDEEEGAIWALHYFFFNKTRKRVCYLYVRGVPVMSHSPRLRPRLASGGLGSSADHQHHLLLLSSSAKRRALTAPLRDDNDAGASGSGTAGAAGGTGAARSGASKRARYWLGDRVKERVATLSDDDMDDDGLVWNRDADGDLTYEYGYDDDYDDDDDEDEDDEDDYRLVGREDEDIVDEDEDDGQTRKSPVRGVSEDIASRMEIEI